MMGFNVTIDFHLKISGNHYYLRYMVRFRSLLLINLRNDNIKNTENLPWVCKLGDNTGCILHSYFQNVSVHVDLWVNIEYQSVSFGWFLFYHETSFHSNIPLLSCGLNHLVKGNQSLRFGYPGSILAHVHTKWWFQPQWIILTLIY